MIAVQNLCYNCFQEHTGPEACPHCGFDLAENVQKFPVALRAGTVLNDRYIVGRVLGQGGFGITYVAFDTQLQTRVAVKEYMPNEIATRIEGTTVSVAMDTRAEDFTYGAERFQEEARTLAKFIGHPNIAGVSSYFDQNDTSYFVMDYIEGVSFKSYIANNGGRVTVDETLNVMIPVLRALTAVHAEGFIHRDVTPDNIYISKDGNVKLLDFGSARYSIGDKSKSLDVILKVGYAPKEQYIRRGRQGPYTDVYSCAACFYAALTGFLPPESLERLDHDELVPVSQAGIDIPEWLDKAILKGLAVQPEDRFQSAAEFLDTIENQLVVEVPTAGAAPAQPAKKKPKPLVIGGIVAALVVAVGIGAMMGGRGSTPGSGTSGGGAPATGTGGGLTSLVDNFGPKVTIAGQEYSANATELDLRDKDLTDEDLKALTQFTNLVSLNLSGNDDISDLSPLAQLTKLEKLVLSNPQVSDLTPLSGLTNLKELRLATGDLIKCKITDLSPLSPLVNLETLGLPSSPNYTDFSPLAGMTRLRVLSMMGTKYGNTNSVDSLEFVRNMSELERLDLVVRDVDLSPLAGATGLVHLELVASDYVGESMDIFSGMTNLEALILRKSKGEGRVYAKDLEALSGLTELRQLYITISGLETLSGIEKLTALEQVELDLRDSTATTLAPMSALSNLRSFYIYIESPLDIGALANLTELQTVNIHTSGKPVTNPSAVDHVDGALID